jgi:hypothetical protein
MRQPRLNAAAPRRRDNAHMSEVTNVLLAFSILEDSGARIEEVNRWLAEEEQLPLGSIWRTEAAVGGGKRRETPLYAGAFKPFDVPDSWLSSARSVGLNRMRSRSSSTPSTTKAGASSTPECSVRLAPALRGTGPAGDCSSRLEAAADQAGTENQARISSPSP